MNLLNKTGAFFLFIEVYSELYDMLNQARFFIFFFLALSYWANAQMTSPCATFCFFIAPRMPLLCFYPILTSSVMHYGTYAHHHGIYLSNRTFKKLAGLLSCYFHGLNPGLSLKSLVRSPTSHQVPSVVQLTQFRVMTYILLPDVNSCTVFFFSNETRTKCAICLFSTVNSPHS